MLKQKRNKLRLLKYGTIYCRSRHKCYVQKETTKIKNNNSKLKTIVKMFTERHVLTSGKTVTPLNVELFLNFESYPVVTSTLNFLLSSSVENALSSVCFKKHLCVKPSFKGITLISLVIILSKRRVLQTLIFDVALWILRSLALFFTQDRLLKKLSLPYFSLWCLSR